MANALAEDDSQSSWEGEEGEDVDHIILRSFIDRVMLLLYIYCFVCWVVVLILCVMDCLTLDDFVKPCILQHHYSIL